MTMNYDKKNPPPETSLINRPFDDDKHTLPNSKHIS